MFYIISGRAKSGKSLMALELAKNCYSLLYYTDKKHNQLHLELRSPHIFLKSVFTITTLEEDIIESYIVSRWNSEVVKPNMVIIDCGCSFTSDDKEYIADIAEKTQTKIIICEPFK